MTIQELRTQLDTKTISAVELTERFLERIEKTNPALNSFITVTVQEARRQALHAQEEIQNGNSGPFTGIPYAAKDLFCTRDVQTTAGSLILKGYKPPYTATAIAKCRDAVLLGKTNLDEFAMGSSGENSAFGATKNPFDLTRVPGGSSSGSAAAVAAGQSVFAFGTDTGGSIRQPASFTNVVGFKPTYGRISRYGVISMSSSLDTVGFFTNTIGDSAYLLQHLAGPDPLDSTTPHIPVDDYLAALQKNVKGMRIGVPKEYMEQAGLHPDIRALCERVLETLHSEGAEIIEVSLPYTKYALPTYYVLCPSEVSSNLSRYDGMQYGWRSGEAQSLEEVFLKTREEGFGPEAKRRIMIGTFCLSSGYYEAYYKKAQQIRTLIKQDFDRAFERVDVLCTPTSPTPPFVLGERATDPLAMYAADVFTVPSALAGLPAVSVPVGEVEHLPAAVQFIGGQFAEATVLRAAATAERSIGHVQIPLKV